MKKFLSLFKLDKQTIIGVIIVLIVFGTIKYCRHTELANSSITVDGKIIECTEVNYSGACVVKVEYKTLDGEMKTTEVTLYKKTNCEIGKIVKLQYSTKSNLTNVLE